MSLSSRLRTVLADLDALRRKLESIQAEVDAQGEGGLAHKKPNGRLTEAGIRELYAMMDGGYTDAEIARELGIRHTSVIPYRQRFAHERSRSKRRRS